MKRLLGLLLLSFFIGCGQGNDISGVYVVDNWGESILFQVEETGYEVVKTARSYSFTLIGVRGEKIIGRKETIQSVRDGGFYVFQMLPEMKVAEFRFPAVILKLKPDNSGLEGLVVQGDETHPIHFRRIRK
jgi:hypothetical protein